MLAISTDRYKALLAATGAYVETVLQAPVVINGPIPSTTLPAFLTQRYVLIEGAILDRPCILMLAADIQDDTPVTIAKHRDLVRRQAPGRAVILVTERL